MTTKGLCRLSLQTHALGDLQVQALLGEGGFAKVFRGLWRGLVVGIKVRNRELALETSGFTDCGRVWQGLEACGGDWWLATFG